MAGNGRRGRTARNRGRRARRQSEGPAAFGASEITQARVVMKPEYGPSLPIARSTSFDLVRAATSGGFFFDWSLSDISNVAEFTSLFAQWKLTRACITFTWRSANEANPTRPIFTLAMDPFATAAPTALTELQERPHRTWSPNAQRTVLQLACRPKAIALTASGAGSGSLVVNALAPASNWYTTAAPSLSYGALLLWVDGWGAGAGTITVKQDYWFSFRSTK